MALDRIPHDSEGGQLALDNLGIKSCLQVRLEFSQAKCILHFWQISTDIAILDKSFKSSP